MNNTRMIPDGAWLENNSSVTTNLYNTHMNLNELLIDIIDTQIDVEIRGLCLNAANIQAGDVFVALQGQSTHGVDYVDQAIENGCIAVLVDSQDFDCNVPSVRIL